MANAYLLSMPLHAVTEVYGEAGLRELFAMEIKRFLPAERALLLRALALASELHRDDRRVREPYVNHLLRVTIRIMRYYQVSDVEVLVAALLHDAVEDHAAELAAASPGPATDSPHPGAASPGPATDSPHPGAASPGSATDSSNPRAAALGVLRRDFGARVADLVAAVTNPEYDADRDTHEQYREHVATALDDNPWARVIKVSDFTDNGVGVIHTTGPKVRRSATKYQPLVPVLRELVARPDTPLPEQVKEHIFEQLDLAEERFAAILGS